MRKRIEFWLDDKRDEDVDLYNLIIALKNKRQFSRAVHEGLRMWADTEQSELVAATRTKPDGGAGQLDEIKAMLELLIAQRKSIDSGYSMQSLKPTTGKQIAAPNFAMPNFEDDEMPALSVKKDTSVNASLNFMASIGGLM